jgi:hypothetical protein
VWARQHQLRPTSGVERLLAEDSVDDPADDPPFLRRKIEELILETLRWTNGLFTLLEGVETPDEAEGRDLKISLPHLLLEGMRRIDEIRYLSRRPGAIAPRPVNETAVKEAEPEIEVEKDVEPARLPVSEISGSA